MVTGPGCSAEWWRTCAGAIQRFSHSNIRPVIAAAPAPHKIAEQIYTQGIQTQMAVRFYKGEAMDKTLDWAAKEIEGFMRN